MFNYKDFGLELKDAVAIRRRYVRREVSARQKQKARWFELYYKDNKEGKWLCLDNIKRLNNEIQALEFSVRNYHRASKIDLAEIKKIPIPKILDMYGIKMNRGFFKLRREENTPSCKYYESTNSFYDFGSGKGGSNIDLVMELDDCRVVDAIKKLKACG